ncbi:MAG: tRNA lysidine(34) synthetase TilS [Oceanospirillaceae bacterium]|nr:tRNA lysidine(34) synthetase TilS [Oceanospirillaceae bacterium]MAR01962.1 tRNA lysidine(34) synthetase TilS [Oceanospirillaceae bacterium]|tara:strand:+ start:68730 stop:70124 length:1395 start_codon:yes stop_codon:yes gene_type:complete
MPSAKTLWSWSFHEWPEPGAVTDQLIALLSASIAPYPQRPLYLGLSGGLDSVLLLHCLSRDPAWRERLTAIHINHQLMAEADHWQQLCGQLCDSLGVAFQAQKVVVETAGQGIEAAARAARYQAFDALLPADALLLLAHHADDQAETLLLRLLRGSGLNGLSAMPARRPLTAQSGDTRLLLRPWLSLPRAELEVAARGLQLHWVQDPSNHDRAYDRNWLRHDVLPVLAGRTPNISQRLAATAQRLQQDQALLTTLLTDRLEPLLMPCNWPCTASLALDLGALKALGPAYFHHALNLWLQRNGLPPFQGDKLPHWLSQCLVADPDRHPSVPYAGHTLQRFGDALYAWRLPESAPQPCQLTSTTLVWCGGVVQTDAGTDVLAMGAELVAAADIDALKVPWPGRPSRTAKQLWQEQQVPVWLRPVWPVIRVEGRVLGLPGLTPVSDGGRVLCAADSCGWQPVLEYAG